LTFNFDRQYPGKMVRSHSLSEDLHDKPASVGPVQASSETGYRTWQMHLPMSSVNGSDPSTLIALARARLHNPFFKVLITPAVAALNTPTV
jgi:hypothetical protein